MVIIPSENSANTSMRKSFNTGFNIYFKTLRHFLKNRSQRTWSFEKNALNSLYDFAIIKDMYYAQIQVETINH